MESYQQRVSECLQFAEASQSFEDRNMWRELALCWLRLCDHAAKFHAGGAKGGARLPPQTR